MPLIPLLITVCGPPLVKEIAKTIRKLKKSASEDRIAELEQRIADLEIARKWEP